jgi:lipoprotein-releasing system permease protein
MEKSLPDTKPFAAFEWLLAFRYLRARRKEGFISVISIFSLLGIMLGVATLIVVMAVFNGFRTELLDKILGSTGHAMLYKSDRSPIEDFKSIQSRLESVDGVTRVIALVDGQVLVTSNVSSTGALVHGISEADIAKLKGLMNRDLVTAMADPSAPDAKPTFAGFDKSGGVAIGSGLAQRHQLGLGSNITIVSPEGPETVMGNAPRMREFPVVAIFKLGLSEYDDSILYMPLADAQEFFVSERGVSSMEVMVDKPDDIAEIIPGIRQAAGDLWLQTWQERFSAFFSALAVERNVMFFVLTMIILVAAMNIISGLIMLVKDKGHDIAILRTMGATKGAIQRVFLITGALIGVTGTILGLILGTLICANAENIRKVIQWFTGVDPFNAQIYYLATLPAEMDASQTAWIAVMSLVLSLLATLYPSWRAAKLDPVEALRYE